MSTITWQFPKDESELSAVVSGSEALLHGGGTGILRNPPREGVLVDTAGAGIDAINVQSGSIAIGGAATYAAVIHDVGALYPDHVLVQALREAASPALRNRITVGGSLTLFPPWSSPVGPLVAVDATIRLIGASSESVAVDTYLTDRSLHDQTAIAEVHVPVMAGWSSAVFRYVRTRFTYPLFTVTVLVRLDAGSISGARIVLVGCRNRFARLTDLEERVVGSEPGAISVNENELTTAIPDRQGLSSEYLTHVAAVEIERAICRAGGDS